MSSFSFRRAVVALVLGMTLAGSWASAAETRSRAAHRPGRPVAQEAQAVFGSLWGSFVSFWTKNGASADPNGGGRSSQAAATGSAANCENGGSVDPFGRCASGH
jgi:pectin methylesterase-like acyl-CoA thioesterase